MTGQPSILFVAHRIPFPPDRGDKIRSWHVLKHLAGLAQVHLACFADDAKDAAHLPALREALGGRLGEAHVEVRHTGRAAAGLRALLQNKPASLTLFDSPGLRAFIGKMLLRPDVGSAFVFSGQMAQYVPPGTPFIMDFGDVDSAKFADYADQGGALAWVHRREAAKLSAFEGKVAERAEASLFVSDAEADLFRRTVAPADAQILAVQNGVDLEFYHPRAAVIPAGAPHPLIIFTGQMDYTPNIDAVSWFAWEVLPRVKGATFAIVGRKPPERVRALANGRVIVTGAVDDVRSWLRAADVVVAPLRIARGIQNKVLEAMAMGRPVVASPAAFEGIDAEPGRHLLVADGAEAQARAISALLEDPGQATTIGAAARRRMEEAYRWEAKLAPLEGLISRVSAGNLK